MKQIIRHIARASTAPIGALAVLALKTRNTRTVPVEFHHERKSVFCIATSDQAEQIVTHLKAAKFSPNDISVQLPDQDTTHDFLPPKNTKAAEGTLLGAGTGGAAGGAFGWTAGLATLGTTGCDPIVVGLSVGALGAVLLGMAGGWIGCGLPKDKFKAGDILVAVHTENSGEIARVKAIFTKAGAQDGCARGEASVEDRPPPTWTRRVRPSYLLVKCQRLLKPAMPEWTRRVLPAYSQPPLAAPLLLPA